MPRYSFGWNLLTRCKSVSIGRGCVEERKRRRTVRRRARNERWPGEVHSFRRVNGECRSILRAAVEHPVVVADANRSRKRAAAVDRFCERDITYVALVHLAPGSVKPTCVVAGQRC